MDWRYPFSVPQTPLELAQIDDWHPKDGGISDGEGGISNGEDGISDGEDGILSPLQVSKKNSMLATTLTHA